MDELELTSGEKKLLLELARQEISNTLTGVDSKVSLPKGGTFYGYHGAFVTLHKEGHLRGCIGMFSAEQPLHRTICDMAYSAAFKDPRFPPVHLAELPLIDIEISVLSPLDRISDVADIQVGRHGLYIIKGLNRGVLLPQVATECGWDKFTFLEQTCYKAGLAENDWKKEADIYVFTASIFGEKDKAC